MQNTKASTPIQNTEQHEGSVLLKILALANHEIEQGQVKPVADAVDRLRPKYSWQNLPNSAKI